MLLDSYDIRILKLELANRRVASLFSNFSLTVTRITDIS